MSLENFITSSLPDTSFFSKYKKEEDILLDITKEDYTYFINICLDKMIKGNNQKLIEESFYLLSNLTHHKNDQIEIFYNPYRDSIEKNHLFLVQKFLSDLSFFLCKNKSCELTKNLLESNNFIKTVNKSDNDLLFDFFIQKLSYYSISSFNEDTFQVVLKYRSLQSIEEIINNFKNDQDFNTKKVTSKEEISLLSFLLNNANYLSLNSNSSKFKSFNKIFNMLLNNPVYPSGHRFNQNTQTILTLTKIPLFATLSSSYDKDFTFLLGKTLIQKGARLEQPALSIQSRQNNLTVGQFIKNTNKKLYEKLLNFEKQIQNHQKITAAIKEQIDLSSKNQRRTKKL